MNLALFVYPENDDILRRIEAKPDNRIEFLAKALAVADFKFLHPVQFQTVRMPYLQRIGVADANGRHNRPPTPMRGAGRLILRSPPDDFQNSVANDRWRSGRAWSILLEVGKHKLVNTLPPSDRFLRRR